MCGNPKPIDLKTWQLYRNDDTHRNGKHSHCGCQMLDKDNATEQDIRMYKYLWNKITQLRASNKVHNK